MRMRSAERRPKIRHERTDRTETETGQVLPIAARSCVSRMFGLTIETTGSSTAQPMVGRVEASKRATCAADHLRATFEPVTEGGGAVKCGYKQLKSHTRRHIEGQVSKRCWGLFRVTEACPTPTNPRPMAVGHASVVQERTWRSARAVRPAPTERTLANWKSRTSAKEKGDPKNFCKSLYMYPGTVQLYCVWWAIE